MAQVIASVEIEAYDDGTFEVSQDSATDNEATEPQGSKTKSLAQALSMARNMLSGAGQVPSAPPSQYMPGNVNPSAITVR